ncbi:TonB-dependent ferric siderophore receptor [Stutzerimonas stutzeri B1SMN1]|uniref:TonB-dependent receptor n=1 Tax=Stutzerimonas stutzeri TaxID=316 RepID=UPI00035726D5|nr:TonB-dependent receptor [Stutzerimonas stutzeri]EPL61129.1 TonB-dependent ferric siderophore receptor [Stutzerimonas stutzeri B1SMN1]MBH3354306.1 TonB-dependent receptor [Stutzerimonas stutzeri]QXP24818.1 TonB-dependent receptor [Stutzerimonas stutzeri]HAN54526.1 TonB-dependent siderophore receptor [Pseudomonas sp.]
MPTLRFSRKTALLPVCLAASFAGSPLMAQEQLEEGAQSSAAEPVELQSVEITASADASADGLTQPYAGEQVARGGRVGILGNQDYMETPFTSTAYTSKLIQDQQARSVSDIVQNDPSVRVARGFGNMQELYVVRGFTLFSDDISYNGLYGLLPRQYVAAEFIERAEVFRGASAFLNGAAPGGTGLGGAINLLPKRAPNEPLTRMTVGANSGGQGTVAADLGRRFGEGNQFGIRLNAAKRAGETGVEDENQTLDMFALGLDYQGDRLRLSADVGHQYHFLDNPRPSVTPNGGIPSAPDADDNFAQPWTYSKEKQTFGTFRAEYDFADTITGWAAAGVRNGEEQNRLANPRSTPAGITTATRFDNSREDRVSTGEIGLRGRTQTGAVSHQLVTSASTYSSEERNAWAASNSDTPFDGNLYHPYDAPIPLLTSGLGSLSDPKVAERIHTHSIAIADTMGFLDERLLVTLGARRQGIEIKGYNNVTGNRTSHYNRYETTPVAGILYQLNDELSVYANYIEGLTKGDTAPAESGGQQVLNSGTSLAPYVAKQTEIGLKYDGGNLGGSIAVFSTERPFGIVENQVFREGGEQRNRGIELSVFGEPAYGTRLLGGLTLLDAEQKKTLNGVNDGNDAIGVPKAQANIGGEWDVPGVQGLTLTSLVVHTGKQYASASNDLRLPSWTRLDLGARYRMTIDDRDVTFRARLDNATGRDYWASAGGYPGANYLVLGAPRTLSVSATVDF